MFIAGKKLKIFIQYGMKIFDLHCDALTVAQNPLEAVTALSKKAFVNFSIYRENLSFFEAEKLAESFNALNLLNACLSFEDIGYADLNEDRFFALKPFCASLTYNGEGVFGYGVNENKPLKKRGLDFIKKLNERGVAVDTAHLSEKGSFDVYERAKFVINTHTAFMSGFKHKRNITDEQIAAIISRGGIIGLTFVTYFLGDKKVNAETVANFISDFCDKFGDNNLAIGTDFFGTDSLPANLNDYGDFINLSGMLVRRGFSKKTIDNIFYFNAYNFYLKVINSRI